MKIDPKKPADPKAAVLRGIKEELGIELDPKYLILLRSLTEEGKKSPSYPLDNNTFINYIYAINVNKLPPEVAGIIPILRTDTAEGAGKTKKLLEFTWVNPQDSTLWPPDPIKHQIPLSSRLAPYLNRYNETIDPTNMMAESPEPPLP